MPKLALGANAAPELEDNAGLPAPNSKDEARSAVPSNVVTLFPFLPIQITVPVPEPLAALTPPQGNGISCNTEEIAVTPAHEEISSHSIHPGAENAEANLGSFHSVPRSTVNAPVLTPALPSIPNVDLDSLPNLAMPRPVCEASTAANDVRLDASLQSGSETELPSDLHQVDLPVASASATSANSPQELTAEPLVACDLTLSPSDIPCNMPARALDCAPARAVPSIAEPSRQDPTIQPQKVTMHDDGPTTDASPSIAVKNISTGRKTEAAKLRSDAHPQSPELDPQKSCDTSVSPVISEQGIQARSLPTTRPRAVGMVNASSGGSSAVSSLGTQNKNFHFGEFEQSTRAHVQNEGAQPFFSTVDNSPVAISATNSKAQDFAGRSSDSPDHKNSPPVGISGPLSATSSSPQILPTASLSANPVGQQLSPPATPVASQRPDAHSVAPELTHNLQPPDEPHAKVVTGSVQAAQILSKAAHSEMRIGLNTPAFGNVEVRTFVRSNDVGVQIGSEKGDLPALLLNDIPGIANSLQQHDLHLTHVSFHPAQGFAFSSDSSPQGNPQPRSFGSRPNSFNAHVSEQPVIQVTTPAEPAGTRVTGFSILA